MAAYQCLNCHQIEDGDEACCDAPDLFCINDMPGEIVKLRAALTQQAEPDAYGYASRLAVALWEKHYKDIAPQWKPLDDLMGVLTQIDNMTSGLTRLEQQAEPVEPVAWWIPKAEQFCIAKRGERPFAKAWEPLYTAPPQQAEPVEPVEPVGAAGLFTLAHLWAQQCYFKGLGRACDIDSARGAFEQALKAYTAPPQRKPLTDEEIDAMWRDAVSEEGHTTAQFVRNFARAIERAHGIGDNT